MIYTHIHMKPAYGPQTLFFFVIFAGNHSILKRLGFGKFVVEGVDGASRVGKWPATSNPDFQTSKLLLAWLGKSRQV